MALPWGLGRRGRGRRVESTDLGFESQLCTRHMPTCLSFSVSICESCLLHGLVGRTACHHAYELPGTPRGIVSISLGVYGHMAHMGASAERQEADPGSQEWLAGACVVRGWRALRFRVGVGVVLIAGGRGSGEEGGGRGRRSRRPGLVRKWRTGTPPSLLTLLIPSSMSTATPPHL